MGEKAELIVDRKLVLADGAIIQLKVWRLPEATAERPHRLKYSLFYGANGRRIVGYDNERGKGDHKHIDDRELRYGFVSMSRLFEDFEADVREAMRRDGD